MKNLTWQNPEQLIVAQELIIKVKTLSCGIKVKYKYNIPITYIATQLVGFVFAIIMISFGIRAGNNSEQMDEIMLNLKWFFNNIEYFLYAGGIVIICVTIVLYYISYKRYTRAELTNYMNK